VQFSRKYSDAQVGAVRDAYGQGTTAAKVVELAKAGRLAGPDGEPLAAFSMPAATVRSLCRSSPRGRDRDGRPVAVEGCEDVDAVRDELLRVTRRQLARLRRRQQAGEDVPASELREIGRALREIGAIPRARPVAASEPAPRSFVARLLEAHRETPVPVPVPATPEPEPPPWSPDVYDDPRARLVAQTAQDLAEVGAIEDPEAYAEAIIGRARADGRLPDEA
jgi:hypothetical protein